jgi:hypothetical protein
MIEGPKQAFAQANEDNVWSRESSILNMKGNEGWSPNGLMAC